MGLSSPTGKPQALWLDLHEQTGRADCMHLFLTAFYDELWGKYLHHKNQQTLWLRALILRKLVVTSTSLRRTIYSFRGRSRDCQEVLAEVQKYTNSFLNHFTHSCPPQCPGHSENPPPTHLAGFAQAGTPPHPPGSIRPGNRVHSHREAKNEWKYDSFHAWGMPPLNTKWNLNYPFELTRKI